VYTENDFAIGYLENPTTNFTGFDNPFLLLSLEGTTNDYALIGSQVKQNFGKYPSYKAIVPSAKLSSVIGGSSGFLTVEDPLNILATFNHVSIDGEIIKINEWNNGVAEIVERSVGGTVKRFHPSGSSVFGVGDNDVFDNNFYLDSNGKYIYQYRCLAIRNIYKNLSIVNPSIVMENNYNPGLTNLSFGFEIPAHKYVVLSSSVGSGTRVVNIETENLQNYSYNGNLSSYTDSLMRFSNSSGSVYYRKIVSINSNFIELDKDLPSPVNQFVSVEILPGQASNSHQGKMSPVVSSRFSGFYNVGELNNLSVPLVGNNLTRSISYNNIIYLWIKREVPKDVRMNLQNTLPIKFKFTIK
jgi:hypothetical protein